MGREGERCLSRGVGSEWVKKHQIPTAEFSGVALRQSMEQERPKDEAVAPQRQN